MNTVDTTAGLGILISLIQQVPNTGTYFVTNNTISSPNAPAAVSGVLVSSSSGSLSQVYIMNNEIQTGLASGSVGINMSANLNSGPFWLRRTPLAKPV